MLLLVSLLITNVTLISQSTSTDNRATDSCNVWTVGHSCSIDIMYCATSNVFYIFNAINLQVYNSTQSGEEELWGACHQVLTPAAVVTRGDPAVTRGTNTGTQELRTSSTCYIQPAGCHFISILNICFSRRVSSCCITF